MTKRSRKKVSAPDVADSLVALQFDVLDPAPNGTELPEGALPQAVRDCSEFAMLAFLEPMGIACIAGKDEPLMLARHRLILMISESSMGAVLGHMRAYSETVWAGHPVMVSVRPTRLIA